MLYLFLPLLFRMFQFTSSFFFCLFLYFTFFFAHFFLLLCSLFFFFSLRIFSISFRSSISVLYTAIFSFFHQSPPSFDIFPSAVFPTFYAFLIFFFIYFNSPLFFYLFFPHYSILFFPFHSFFSRYFCLAFPPLSLLLSCFLSAYLSLPFPLFPSLFLSFLLLQRRSNCYFYSSQCFPRAAS